MYTLRIIDQTKVGVEERRNIFIGDEYSVLMKVDNYKFHEPVKEGADRFENALSLFYGNFKVDNPPKIDQSIVGFIYSEDKTYPIRDFNVVYIVGSEGQTIERLYGIYNKY